MTEQEVMDRLPCKRCRSSGEITVEITNHGERNELYQSQCPDCLGKGYILDAVRELVDQSARAVSRALRLEDTSPEIGRCSLGDLRHAATSLRERMGQTGWTEAQRQAGKKMLILTYLRLDCSPEDRVAAVELLIQELHEYACRMTMMGMVP